MKTEELFELAQVEGRTIEQLMKQMDGARRGLGLANKLKGAAKKKHLSIIFTNLNKIRGGIHRLIKEVDTEEK